jgi:hypothetical protein
MENKLKAWLKRNKLTPNVTDHIAVIESFGSVCPDINCCGQISKKKQYDVASFV